VGGRVCSGTRVGGLRVRGNRKVKRPILMLFLARAPETRAAAADDDRVCSVTASRFVLFHLCFAFAMRVAIVRKTYYTCIIIIVIRGSCVLPFDTTNLQIKINSPRQQSLPGSATFLLKYLLRGPYFLSAFH